jgi:NitT/TauT family transport system ATP-binding protein
METILNTRNLCKSFDTLEVLRDINLSVAPGERVALLGPSGAGKTTLLKIMAGLETPSSGTMENHARKTAFVFQEPRLIPWRSVKDNLLFVNADGDYRAALCSVEMEDFADYPPADLSGGMRQRVNLARALITQPDLLILDEAFHSLDLGIKMRLMESIIQRWQEQPFALVCVTHDPKEALYLADRIFVLSTRPASILTEIQMNLSRKLEITSPDFIAQEANLIHILTGRTQPHQSEDSEVETGHLS